MNDLGLLRRDLGLSVTAPLAFETYQAFAQDTDRSGLTGDAKLEFLLLGLFGEIGSLLSELKKKQRDKNAYFAYEWSAQEEAGDVLWYFANVASYLDLSLTHVAAGVSPDGQLVHGETGRSIAKFVELERQDSLFLEPASGEHVQRSLPRVAARAGRLVDRATRGGDTPKRDLQIDLARIFDSFVSAAGDAQISLECAALLNMAKIYGRWPKEKDYGPLFDEEHDSDEQLPRHLCVTFREKPVNGKDYVFQTVKGINLGDRLTDNSADKDDYRFHDVFHLAYAAILGWSPVLRALLRLKRKSKPSLDEEQDGARAIITEEGISNWIFAHGLRHQSFAGVASLDFSLLKTIQQLVKGYEVEVRPLWMWEEAILSGFAVFRQLTRHRGGVVTIDLCERTIVFEPPQ